MADGRTIHAATPDRCCDAACSDEELLARGGESADWPVLKLKFTPPVELTWALLLDQDALLAALREGRIAGAGVDVYDTEPLPAGHPLRTAPRLLATPHLGYVSELNYRTYYGQAVEDIQAHLAGAPDRRLG